MAQRTKAPSALAEAFTKAGINPDQFSQEKGPKRTWKTNATNTQVAAVTASASPSSLLGTPQMSGVTVLDPQKRKIKPSPVAKPKRAKPPLTGTDNKKFGQKQKRKLPSKPPQPSLREYMSALQAAYNTPQRRVAAPKPIVTNSIEIANNAAPNLVAFPIERTMPRLVPSHDGIKANVSDESDDVAEIYIGLDFGTSSTKVILRDANRQVPYAVPFAQVGSGNPYLFPSRVYLCGSQYRLDQPPPGRASSVTTIRDLKITLMRRPEHVEYIIHATAYLALIIRHARGWLFTAHRDAYASSEIEWGLNLGLPAEKAEDSRFNKRFKAIALAAINLAAYPGAVTNIIASKYLLDASRAIEGREASELGLTVHPDMVDIFPEIAAQVVGFVESESWDGKSRPYITLIDIGAGTVDVSFFSVEGKNNRKFQFFQNSVEENGVINLHRARINWLRTTLQKKRVINPALIAYLDEIYQPTDRLSGIPNSVVQYITGLKIIGDYHVDDEFKRLRYRTQVFGKVIRPVKENRVPNGPWDDLPVFICGGGSRMPLYGNIVEELNNTTGISWFKGRRYHLSKPKKLMAAGLSEQEYDRLSVAYGLSFPEIGTIIKSGQIPNFQSGRRATRSQPTMITKDDI